MNIFIKLLICIFLVSSVFSTKQSLSHRHSHYNLHSSKALLVKDSYKHDLIPAKRSNIDSSYNTNHHLYTRDYKRTTDLPFVKGQHASIINKNENHINTIIESKILLREPATQVDGSKEQFRKFYEESQDSILNAHVDAKRRTRNTLENLDKAVEGEFKVLGKEINLHVEAIENRIREEQEKNKAAIDQATLEINGELNELSARLKEEADSIRETKILLLKERLEELTCKLGDANIELDQIGKQFFSSRFLCKGYDECSQCTRDPNCGWCLSEGRCVEGNKENSLNEYCAIYDYNICGGSGCSSFKDCFSCLEESTCGWCANPPGKHNGECLEKSANYTGCPSQKWFHSQGVKDECELEESTSNVVYTIKEEDQSDELKECDAGGVSIQILDQSFHQLQRQSKQLREQVDEVKEEIKFLMLDRFEEQQENIEILDT